MKKSIGYIIFLLCLNNLYTLKAQDWEWVNPLPGGNTLYDVVFINRDTGFAVGIIGTIIKSTDGGKNWKIINCETSEDLRSICFLNETKGFIFGAYGTILKTEDGGNNWKKVEFNNSMDYNFIASNVVHSNRIYALSQMGFLVGSLDGGDTWEEITEFFELTVSMSFKGDTGYIVGGMGAIYKTINGGLSWTYIKTDYSYMVAGYGISLNSVSAAARDTVYISGYDGNNEYGFLIKTTDGGKTWDEVWSEVYDWGFYYMNFTDANTGYASGEGGINKTTDGGKTWNVKADAFPVSFYFADTTYGYAVGSGNAIYTTENAGESWIEQDKDIAESGLNSVYATDSNNVFAVGTGGRIINSTDGSRTWTKQNSGTGRTLNSVFFINDSTGYIASSQGMVLKTKDRGRNWKIDTITSSSINLNSIFFTSSDTGYVAGSSYIYKTVDGGMNWSVSFHEIGIYLNSIFFINSKIGYACGSYNGGVIIKTLDGGQNWLTLNVNAELGIKSLFINENIGYAISSGGGAIYKPTNGDNYWEYQNNYAPGKSLNSICFINDSIGFVVGEEGTILKTENGGKKWLNQTQQTVWDLNSVYFTDSNHGWIVGNSGTILKYIGKKDTGVYIKDNFKEKENLVLYPNPASSYISLKSEDIIKNVSIFSLTGKNIMEKEINCKNTFLNIENLPQGLYIVNIKYKDKFKSMKLIKQ